MPYYKQTIDGKIVGKALALELPDGEGWEIIDGDPSEVDVYVEKTYNPRDFKQACVADEIIAPIMMLAPAALIDAINASNWPVVKAGVDYMRSVGTANVSQYVAFCELLVAHNGPDLEEV